MNVKIDAELHIVKQRNGDIPEAMTERCTAEALCSALTAFLLERAS